MSLKSFDIHIGQDTFFGFLLQTLQEFPLILKPPINVLVADTQVLFPGMNPWQIVFDDLDSLLVVIQKKITCCRIEE